MAVTTARPGRSKAWPGVLCAAVAEALALCVLAPIAAAVIQSLTGPQGLAAYAQWWAGPRGWDVLGQTLRLAALAAATAVGLGWLLAWAARRLAPRKAMLMAALACLGVLIPSSTLATAWIQVAGRQTALGRVLASVGVSLYSEAGAAFVLALRYVGVATVILTAAGLQRDRTWPAERVFRPGALAAWRQLSVSADLGALAAAGLLVMLLCLTEHIIPGMLLVSTVGTLLTVQYSARFDMAGATALAIPAALTAVTMAGVALWLVRGHRQEPATAGHPPPPVRPRTRVVAGIGVALVFAVSPGVPAWVLAEQVDTWRAPLSALADARAELTQTLWCASLSGVLAAAAGAILAGRWARARRVGSPTLAPLVAWSLATGGTLPALGIVRLFQTPALSALDGGLAPLVLACVCRFVPVATLVCNAAWRGQSDAPWLAARVHGVGAWRRLWHVTWPRRRRAVLWAAVLCALLTATELEMSILLAAPGRATLGIRLYSLIHTASAPTVAALTLGIILLAAPAMAVCVLWRPIDAEGERR